MNVTVRLLILLRFFIIIILYSTTERNEIINNIAFFKKTIETFIFPTHWGFYFV